MLLQQVKTKVCKAATLIQGLVEDGPVPVVEVLHRRMTQEYAGHRPWDLAPVQERGGVERERPRNVVELGGRDAGLTALQRRCWSGPLSHPSWAMTPCVYRRQK